MAISRHYTSALKLLTFVCSHDWHDEHVLAHKLLAWGPCDLYVQAEAASEKAAAAQKARKHSEARMHEAAATEAQQSALLATREAESVWTEAQQLLRKVQKHDASADAGLRKARRLSRAGECTWQAQALADTVCVLEKEALASRAEASETTNLAAEHEQARSLINSAHHPHIWSTCYLDKAVSRSENCHCTCSCAV